MYYPFCERCHTKNNFGYRLCGSCETALDIATNINTALKRFKNNREKAMRFLGYVRKETFYKHLYSIKEVRDAHDDMKDNGEFFIPFACMVKDKAQDYEVKFCNRILRETAYFDLSEEKQKEFMDWVLSIPKNDLSFREAREKLLTYNRVNEEVIRI